jgi:hypothetical protein
MQRRVFNCATIRVVNTTDISGTATADEVNRSLRTRKGRSLGRITFSTLLGPLMAAGLFVALAPMPVRADSAETAALQAQVTSLQATVSALQGQVNTQQGQINTLQKQLTMAKSVLALAPYVAVTLDSINAVIGPNIIFTGANIHIRSGSGLTNDGGGTLTGLGNLIIGYNEVPDGLSLGDRGGAHNLVIGSFNKFTQFAFGGLVAGEINTISAESASVSGGLNNTASGPMPASSAALPTPPSATTTASAAASTTPPSATTPASPAVLPTPPTAPMPASPAALATLQVGFKPS